MPELPEVETVVRDLRPLVVGRAIRSVRRSRKKLRRSWRASFDAVLVGATVTGVRRRGKWILVDLDTPNPQVGQAGDHAVLIVHLGMTGQFTVVGSNEPVPDHLHLVFGLENSTELRFRDPRRFGSVGYDPSAAHSDLELDSHLGPEPFDLDPEVLRVAFGRTARSLKGVLLDQRIVAGVGNIYADESCHRARLNPTRLGKSLSAEECDRLRAAIESVLMRAIASRGSTIRDYIGGSGLRGGFQDEFAVYGRSGEPCRECGTAIACIRLAGRATHYCPACQPLSPRRTHRSRRKSDEV